MRVSIVKGDPGYRWDARHFKVKFNGKYTLNVLTADEDKGHVVRYILDEDDKPKIAPDGQHYMIETVEGKVEVEAILADGVNLREPKVAVEMDRDDAGNAVVAVLVYSRIKPGQIRRTRVDEKTIATRHNMGPRAAVSIVAGAAAEHLIAKFGDAFEPSAVAEAATTAYDKLLAQLATRH